MVISSLITEYFSIEIITPKVEFKIFNYRIIELCMWLSNIQRDIILTVVISTKIEKELSVLTHIYVIHDQGRRRRGRIYKPGAYTVG